MDNIRWILLLAGIVIIAGIYLFSRLQGRSGRQPGTRRRRMPMRRRGARGVPDDSGDSSVVEEELERLERMVAEDASRANATAPAAAPRSGQDPERVVSIYVLAPPGVPFRGTFLLDAMAKAGLVYGEMQIFHGLATVNGTEYPLFSAANLHEPGTFDLRAMEGLNTQGVVLFLQLPGPPDAIRAFDVMVKAARTLADELDGTVCDSTRSVLTIQTIGHMREEIVDYQSKRRVLQSAS